MTIVGRRDPEPCLAQAKFIRKDLSLMKNAKDLVNEIDSGKAFDSIVFSNGITAPQERQVTEEGLEIDLAVSFLSRLAFMKKLFDNAKFGSKRMDMKVKPRIFILGYPGKNYECELDDFNSNKNYSPIAAHMRTVVGNEALVEYVSLRFDRSINVFGVNPGIIKTGIRENLLGKTKESYISWGVEAAIGLVAQSADQYAENILIHLLVSPAYESGKCNTLFESNGSELKPSTFLSEKVRNRVRIIQEAEDLLEKAAKALVNKGVVGRFVNKGMKAVDRLAEKMEREVQELSSDSRSGMGVATVARGGLGL